MKRFSRGSIFKKILAFSGPGLMVAVGYMDPGNWATDIAGGAQFGYELLSIILLSNIFAILLQYLSLKLGIAAEMDLAQACRKNYHPAVNFTLWLLCEIAIAACDLAEVVGSAIALNLLFGLDMVWGVALTSLDVLIILAIQKRCFRLLEIIIGALILVVLSVFVYEVSLCSPETLAVAKGFLPTFQLVTDHRKLYLAIGIIGATVMPHNLYLHSHIVQTRPYPRTELGKKMALKYATLDSTMALLVAFLINAAILIVAAASFYTSGHHDVNDITTAHHLLSPILGTSLAGIFFAIALLASGQNATLTGTLAGQIVMEGFLSFKMKPWVRRLMTRGIAIFPALVITSIKGSQGAADLLIASQLILAMQLGFAIIPLILFTSNGRIMGSFKNSPITQTVAWVIGGIIVILNIILIFQWLF